MSVFMYHPLNQPLGVYIKSLTNSETNADNAALTFVYAVLMMVISSIVDVLGLWPRQTRWTSGEVILRLTIRKNEVRNIWLVKNSLSRSIRLLNAHLEQNKVLIAVHRGAWGGNVIENTIPSFELALQMGADMFECDLSKSTDGVLFAFHDTYEQPV